MSFIALYCHLAERGKEKVGRWKVRTHVVVLHAGFWCDHFEFHEQHVHY